MGFLDALLGGILSGVQQGFQNKFNANEAQKQRDFQSREAEITRAFNSSESALQRDWSSQEAERARDWQEEMNAKYNSISGKISQAEQAGVNPMFAVTGNAVSPASASGSVPSGSAASAGMPSGASATGSFVDLVGNILGLSKLKAEIANIEANTRKTTAEGVGQEISNETLRDMNVQQILESRSRILFNDENTKLVTSKILNTDADTEKKGAELGMIASSIANMDADTAVKQKQIDVMVMEIVRGYKSVDEMSASIALMASEAGLNRARAIEIGQSVRNMVQEYGHRDVVNSFEQMIYAGSASHANYRNPANYSGVNRVARQVLNEIEDLFNFSGTTSPN